MSRLIKGIFLPERIGTNYLFSKRIVGIDIGKTKIRATKVLVKGKQSYIEQFCDEKIAVGTPETHVERVSETLKNIFKKIGKYDQVNTALSSSLVVFKELTLPFTARDKISMVLDFEVEPLLPFPLRDTIIDFIITKQNAHTADILVAAVQKQYIAQHLQFFETAGVTPDTLTVDMFCLFGLYKHIPSYIQLEGGKVLIDIGLHTTRLALIINSQLKMVRTLPYGVSFLAKNAAQNVQLNPNEILADIIRFGFEKPDSPEFNNALKNATELLWRDINLTLTSFSTKFLENKAIAKIILLGGGAEIHGLQSFMTEKTEVPITQFNTKAISENKNIHIKNGLTISLSNVISLAAVIPSEETIDFNLRKNEFTIIRHRLFFKQLSVFLLLTLSIFATLLTHYTIQTRKLQKEIQQSEQEALQALKETFPTLEEERRLSDAIEEAELEVKEQKETWFAFSSQARASFLQYLLELTSKIDKENLGFAIEKISISDGTLVLKASVKDTEALKILERELRQSKLFSYVEPQENPRFTMRITLAPSTQEF